MVSFCGLSIVFSFWTFVFAERSIYVGVSGYRGAVLEHRFVASDQCLAIADLRDQATCIKRENLKIYEENIAEAARQGADIIVFPEQGTRGVVSRAMAANHAEQIPHAGKGWTPCDDDQYNHTHTVQYYYSCMARRYKMYVVGNCVDHKTEDEGVPGSFLYNTAVAYDANGVLVAKYHKYNLFGFERFIFDRPQHAEISFFDTHFGRVGMFICFDILFQVPAYKLVEMYGIKQIAFPTAWIDELPMWSAVGVHSAWAMTMGVNLLSANFRIPNTRLVGSGIFSPDGPLIWTRNTTSSGSILLVAWIPHHDRRTNISYLPFQNAHAPDDTFESYVFHDLHKFTLLQSGSYVKKVCMNDFCCSLEYSATIADNEKYALGVFYGLHTAAQQYLYFQNCILTKCAGSDNSSCGQSVSDAGARFDYLHLEGHFKAAKYVFPTVLLDGVQLPEKGTYEFGIQRKAFITGTSGFERPLLMAALHGRFYNLTDPFTEDEDR